jgi:hypothetical protein
MATALTYGNSPSTLPSPPFPEEKEGLRDPEKEFIQ